MLAHLRRSVLLLLVVLIISTAAWEDDKSLKICKANRCGSQCFGYCPAQCKIPACNAADCTCVGYQGADDTLARHCKPGYRGPKCQYPCPSTCVAKVCTKAGWCAGYSSGSPDTLARHCRPGFWSKTCGQRCPNNCRGKACLKNGKCVDFQGSAESPASHCKPKMYGDYCKRHCPPNCARDVCTRGGQCLGAGQCAGGEPASHCKSGHWGDKCMGSCSNCALEKCTVDGGCLGYDRCDADAPADHCTAGWFGRRCDKRCPRNCASDGCTMAGGCVNGECKSGWFGERCQYPCPSSCTSGRCSKDGACVDAAWIALGTGKERFDGCKPAKTCSSSDAPLPECSKPDGVSTCSFYDNCLEAQHPCGPTGYALEFAKPMCEAFLEYDKDMSYRKEWRAWFRSVRACLQEKAVPLVYDKSLTCDEIRRRAFDSHIPCYTRDDENVCTMPSMWPTLYLTIGFKRVFNLGVLGNQVSVSKVCAGQLASRVTEGIVSSVELQLSHVVDALGDVVEEELDSAANSLYGAWFRWVTVPGFSLKVGGGPGSSSFVDGVHATLAELSHFAGNVSIAAANGDEELLRVVDTAARVLGGTHEWVVDAAAKSITLQGSALNIKPSLDAIGHTCADEEPSACAAAATDLVFDVYYASQQRRV